jgi:hypothetical protein
MFVYFYWPKNSDYHVMAFHKEATAVDYVISSINKLINNDDSSYRPKKKKISNSIAIAIDEFQPALRQAPNASIYFDPIKKEKQDKDTSNEYLKLKAHLEAANKNKTLQNAITAIDLYEEYTTYVLFDTAALHTLQDLRIAK